MMPSSTALIPINGSTGAILSSGSVVSVNLQAFIRDANNYTLKFQTKINTQKGGIPV